MVVVVVALDLDVVTFVYIWLIMFAYGDNCNQFHFNLHISCFGICKCARGIGHWMPNL